MDKNYKFEDILDYCIERLRKGESVEAILQDCPEESDQLKSHLEMAQSLFQLKHPEYEVSAIHGTIFKIGSEQGLRGASKVRNGKMRTILAWAACIVLIIMTGSYATANLADAIIPGDLLYPVKLATEKVCLALVRAPQGEVEMRITLSERRLKEVIASAEQGHFHEAVLTAMLDEAEKAVYNIRKLKGMNRTFMLKKVQSLCASQQDILQDLITITPADDHRQIRQAIMTSAEYWNRCCEMDITKSLRCREKVNLPCNIKMDNYSCLLFEKRGPLLTECA